MYLRMTLTDDALQYENKFELGCIADFIADS